MGAWVPGTTEIWTSGTKVTGPRLRRAHAANVRLYQTYASACGQTHVCFAVYPEGSSIAGELGVGDTETARTPACNGIRCRHAPGPNHFAITYRTSNVPQVRRDDVAHPNCAGWTGLGAAHL